MNIAISNIAWTNEEEGEVATLLQELGVQHVEIAPTKKWNSPDDADQASIEAYRKFWDDHGIDIVAFQSMLFNRPDLKLFDSDENRTATQEYLETYIELARKFGAKVLVFGSPKNRQRNDLDIQTSWQIAESFFGGLGQKAQEENVRFCIEPNAVDYACDFITTAQEGIDLVNKVHNPGFGLHLDIACMTLAKDDVVQAIRTAMPILEHFHISSPGLEQVEDLDFVPHRLAAQTLRECGYDKYVSIEMKPGEVGTNRQRVEKAVRFAQSIYGD